jgi:SAM-dependent methyltransferase
MTKPVDTPAGTAGETTIARDQYFLGYRAAEQRRLQRQTKFLAGDAAWLFDRVGPLDGASVVELGTGPRGNLDALAERVGPIGTVVGVELNREAVDMARRLVADRGLENVTPIHGDARSSGLPGDYFDLATARLVLVNVPQPEEIVAEAVRLTRPGGTVAFHEADALTRISDPPLYAWTRLMDLLTGYAEDKGIDLFVGRRLPGLLRDAGLVDIQSRPIVHIDPPGHPRRSVLPNFVENLKERLVAHGLIARDELEHLQAVVRRHVDDPETLVFSDLFVQAWGRKPG